MLIEILVFPGVDELDALGPAEVLRNAAAYGADFQVKIVAHSSNEDIHGSHGLRFGVDGTLASFGRANLLVIPGGGWVKRSRKGAWAEAQRGEVLESLADIYHSGTILASVCTGTMLIAAAGLLRGRQAVTHRLAFEELRQAGAEIVEARVVDDGNIITCGGVSAGIDLGLYITERFANAELAKQLAENLEYERRGPVHVTARAERIIKGKVAR